MAFNSYNRPSNDFHSPADMAPSTAFEFAGLTFYTLPYAALYFCTLEFAALTFCTLPCRHEIQHDMGCLSCIAYFSHNSCNIADIITSMPSSAYINANNVIYCFSLWHSCCRVYMAFYSYLNELKLDQLHCITTNNIMCGTLVCGSISSKTPTTITLD